MKTPKYRWFEVTIRYYNPAHPVGMTTETIALEAKSFTEAENRARDLYKEFRACEIQSINPALYEEVLFAENYSDVMNWYLVELEEDEQMLQEFYQDLRESECDCSYLHCCSRSNPDCNSTSRNEINIFCNDGFVGVGDDKSGLVYDSADQCRSYHEYTRNGNIRIVDYLNTPTCFRYAGAIAHKAFILVQGRDFTHVLKRVKEYINNSILDYNIFAIIQTHLCDVILRDRCQL